MESKCPVCGKPVEEGIAIEIGGKERVFHERCLEENKELISIVLSWSFEEE